MTLYCKLNFKQLYKTDKFFPHGLPFITYEHGLTLHFNEDTLSIIHLSAGHTDGDSVILWQDHSVIHMGKLFFKDKFPYIDLKAGGSVLGYRDSVSHIIHRINDETNVLPGHGDLANRSDLIRFKQMLYTSIN